MCSLAIVQNHAYDQNPNFEILCLDFLLSSNQERERVLYSFMGVYEACY
jgi:hypothetical protein